MPRLRLPRAGLARLALWFAAGFAATLPARAHEFRLEAAVSTFVQVGGGEAQVLVRAPLYLFRQAKLPSRDGEVDVPAAAPALERALAALRSDVQLLVDGEPLVPLAAAARLSLPSDRSFDDYERALAHIAAAMEPDLRIVVDQGFLDARLRFAVPAGARLALATRIAPELGPALKLTLRYLPPKGTDGTEGASRALVVEGGVGTIELDPSALAAARGFVALGIAHILTGTDHLLFLLALVLPLRGWRPLAAVVTVFTLAHSLALAGAAAGLTPRGDWFGPAVEMLIAVSIVYTALENIVGVDLRRRVLLTLLFGVAHGFGFAHGLQEQLQFAGRHLVVSLLAFNVGIELGQLAVLAVALPLLAHVVPRLLPGRAGRIIVAALLAHVGWHWMEARWDALAAARWPSVDAADLPLLLAWLAALLFVAAAAVAVAKALVGRPGWRRAVGSRA